MSQTIYNVGMNEIVTQTQFIRFLKQFINEGNNICVHSSVKSIGQPAFREGFFDVIIDAFKECVGEQGTILMPVFTYSYCKNEVFNIVIK